MVLFKGNPPGGAEGRPFIYFENHKNYVASFIVVLYDLYRSLATPLPSEMFSLSPLNAELLQSDDLNNGVLVLLIYTDYIWFSRCF